MRESLLFGEWSLEVELNENVEVDLTKYKRVVWHIPGGFKVWEQGKYTFKPYVSKLPPNWRGKHTLNKDDVDYSVHPEWKQCYG